MGERVLDNLSITDYLALEKQSTVKHEYHQGSIYAMSGGTINHSVLGSNMNRLAGNALVAGGKDCTAFNSDLKIYIEATASFVYPDGGVVCGAFEAADAGAHSIVNPLLIVEVLSNSTESYDRGEKFRKYRTLPSFREYVLISQYQPVVETFYRQEKGLWRINTVTGLEQSVYFHSLDTAIAMKDIYHRVTGLDGGCEM